jgi:hypothetical protein
MTRYARGTMHCIARTPFVGFHSLMFSAACIAEVITHMLPLACWDVREPSVSLCERSSRRRQREVWFYQDC